MDINNFLEETDKIKEVHQSERDDSVKERKHDAEMKTIVGTIIDTSNKISSKIDNKTSISVDNFPKSIQTPDFDKIVSAIASLKAEVLKIKTDDPKVHQLLTEVKNSIDNIPQPKDIKFPDYPKEISVNNQKDFSDDIKNVEKAIKGLKLDVKPKIEVMPNVKVENNVNELIAHLEAIRKAIGKISFTIPENDNKPLLKALNSVKASIDGLTFPTPNFILPFTKDGKASQANLDSDGNIVVSNLVNFQFDSVYATYPDTVTEVYTYKLDGDTVGTITIIYNAADKKELVSCIRS